MAFDRREVEDLLVQCHRRCCICHRFCGTKIETDHIEPRAESGNDDIDNAIPVCFECHAEIHSYNPDHPRGRKFTPGELRKHKEQWLEICRTRPQVLIEAQRDRDVGPLQALIDELEYNLTVVSHSLEHKKGAMFRDAQFERGIQEGAISVLEDKLRRSILDAYEAISRANQQIIAELHPGDIRLRAGGHAALAASTALKESKPLIEKAHGLLIGFLGHNTTDRLHEPG
ncbi:MAG TPA: HNH endonuclease signature motif containing protein [Phycisphaerae bacterium]|nr:HNH endonuclease signature motif containing protein [Phycisphaerae bacterium]